MLYKATPPAEQNLVALLDMMGTHAINLSLDHAPQTTLAANDNPRETKIVALWSNRDDMTASTTQAQAPTRRTSLETTNLFLSNTQALQPVRTPTTAPSTTQKMSIFRVNKDATDTTTTTPVVTLPTRDKTLRSLDGNVITFRPRVAQVS
jgi:hypothetical protein